MTFGSVGGAITSSLGLSVDSTSTLTLHGNNNLTGGITLSGKLVIGDTGAAGGSGNTITTTGSVINYADGVDNTANIQIASNSTQLEVLGTDVATQSVVISQDASTRGFEKIGAGTLILGAANSYTGTTVVSAGILGLGSNGAAGTGTITLADNTALLNAAPCGCGPLTLTNAIQIALGGAATIDTDGYETVLAAPLTGGNLIFADTSGGGTVYLAGANSYGNTRVAGGATLMVGNGGTTGSLGSGSLSMGGGTLIFDRSDDITFADSIMGSGQITKLGAGTLTLSGDNLNGVSGPYLGTFSIQAGSLAVGQFGLGASQLVEIDNGAVLKAFEDSYAGDVAILPGGGTIDTGGNTFEMIGAIDLQGEVTKTGSGTLLLDDVNEEGTGAGGINVVAGTLGLGSDFAAGTGVIKLASGTTLLNAACGCSNLTIDNEIRIALGGSVTFDGAGNDTDLNGAISGGDIHFTTSQSAPFAGSIFRLNGANSYGDTLIGPNVALIVYDGTLGTGNVTFEAAPSDPTTPAALVFQNATDYSFGGKIIGAGLVSIESDPGYSVTFTGSVEVISGRLVINGDFGDMIGNGATLTLEDSCFCGGPAAALGGSGTFHGNVTLGAATLNPGNSPGMLVIAGNLTLGSASILNYELGEPGTPGGTQNDLVTVGGDLTLDGTLNTAASGAGYGPGYYRLFNYGGTLIDNGLDAGTIAGGLDAAVLTNINGQVNVRIGGSQAIQYWDGADIGTTVGAAGGAGVWNGSTTNWTGPTGFAINDGWQQQVGVFGGAAGGTVTVAGTQGFEELRFETDGYVLSPSDTNAALNTTGGFSIIDVANGTTANISVVIQGGAGLDKTGAGTLILSAANSYGGATDVAAGTLRLGINNAISNQSALNVQAGAAFDLAGFQTQSGSLTGAGTITLGGGRLEAGYDNGSTIFSGTMTGPDGGESVFTKNGSGTLTLSGTIALGNGAGDLKSFSQINVGTLLISGTGSYSADLIQNFSTLENNGTISAFTVLQTFGSMTNMATGTVNGSIQNFGSFASRGIINGTLSNFGTALVENQVNGALGNFQAGATVTLTGAVTGITSYEGAQGALFDLAGFNTAVGGLNGAGGDIQLGGATLTVDNSTILFSDYSGSVTGPGLLVKTGAGEQVMRGVSANAPIVHVDAGTFTIADTGLMNTDVIVANGATFNNYGTVGGYITNDGLLNLGGTSSVNSVLALALINNSGGVTHAAGTFNAGVQNAGIFYVDGTLNGVPRFDQDASGQLALNTDFGVGQLTGSGTVDTGFYTLSVGSGDLNASFDGVISGSGGLTKTGAGTFTLSGDQGYTGQTVVNGGVLTLTGTGAITGHVNNYASFESAGVLRGGLYNETGATALLERQVDGLIENHGTITLSDAITGNGAFEQASSGIFDLAGHAASFGALDGAGQIDLGAGRLTIGGNDSDSGYAGTITGTGGITKTGAGTLTLSNGSTYGGATFIDAGTLQLVDGGAIGAGNVTNNAVLAFDGAIDRSFGNTIQGSGSIVKTGANLVTLTGTNDYSGTSSVLQGALGFDNGLSLGNGVIALADGTSLRNVQSASTVSLANDIQIAANGMATLQGIDGSNAIFNGMIGGGTARFDLSGAGGTAFTLGTANSYADTRIGGGVALTVGGARTLGLGDTSFEASGVPSSLTFANGSNYSYGGTISGDGNVIVDTASAGVSVTLTGSNSAALNFTGAVTVDSGRLVLNGAFGDVANNSASLTLNGGSLGGNGMFHGDLTFGAASLNPGNSPGTLSIAGNLLLGTATILNFELGEAGTVGGANNDLVNVGGNLTLDGTLNVIAQPSFGEGYYRLFNYGGAPTDNGLIMGSLPAGYTPSLLTNIAGQVNILFASSPQAIQYWDGTDLTGSSTATGGNGGVGTWSNTSTNWTAPTGYGVNDSWRGQVAVFGGTSGGAVTVQGTQAFQELRFTSGGYVIAGTTAADGLATTGGFSVVDVAGGADATIEAVISGSGGLTKTGIGTLTLGGANSYTGTTTVSGGTLALVAGGSLASGVVNDAIFNNQGVVAGQVVNNTAMTSTGTLNGGLDNRGSAAISGALNGAVINTTSGMITLTGTTTGIGAVTQSGNGRFELNGFDTSFGSLSGTGTVALGSATLTLGGNNGSTSFSGVISGGGGLTKTGTGTFTLTESNTYTRATLVSAGTLSLSATGGIAGNLRNQATLTNAGTVSGMVQNDGTLTSTGAIVGGLLNNGNAALSGTVGTGIVNNGGIIANGTATFAALQQATAGTFSLGGFGASVGTLTGSGAITLASGGTLTIGAGNGNSSYAGTVSGAGSLAKAGTGTLVLTGAATQTGGTTISDGTLQIGTGGTTGSLSGAIINNGVLVISRSDAVTLANVMSGTGGFVQAGTGTTTLTGANSYTGGTLVSTGRLRGDTGSLQGNIRIDSALEFAQTGVGTYAGDLSGAGLLEKTGTGTLNFTGNSAIFTGATNVLAGTLALNGLLTHSPITVSNGATLAGTGTAGGLVVQSGGTIAPGNSVGTFNVAGNVLFQAGSLFAAEVSAAGADKIQATGTAQLNGTLQVIALGGNYSINNSLVLLHADAGVSGTFNVTGLDGFGLAYRPKIIYTANEVQLLLAPNQLSAVLGNSVPLTYNQRSTIDRIDAALMIGGYDPTPLAALYSLAPAAIPAALDQLSGEVYADATRTTLDDERVVREAVTGRLADAADLGLSGNGSWGQAIGSWGSVDGDGNAAGYDVNRTGLLIGIDAGGVSDDGSWRAGVIGHYTHITLPASSRGSGATINRTGGGFYAGAALGGLRIRTGATLSLLDLKAQRQVSVPGLRATGRGKATGVMLQTFAELSYRIETGKDAFVAPYLTGSVSRVRFARFAESSGPVSLIVREQKDVLGIAELGVRGDVPLGVSAIRLGGNIGLRTAFGDRTANPIIALAAAPNQAFNVHSAEIDRFAGAANLNLSADLSDTLSLRVGYSGVLSGSAREHGVRATLSLMF